MTSRLNAQAAYERDEGWCQWCLHRRHKFVKAGTPHHIFGRSWDEPEYQIALCSIREDNSAGCHRRIHDTGEITREDIVALAIETIWHGEDKTPEGR